MGAGLPRHDRITDRSSMCIDGSRTSGHDLQPPHHTIVAHHDGWTNLERPILKPHLLRFVQTPNIPEGNIPTPTPEDFSWCLHVPRHSPVKGGEAGFVDDLFAIEFNPAGGKGHLLGASRIAT